MATTGHEHERVEVQGLKASIKKGGNIGIYNDCICSTAAATAAKVTNTVPPSFSLTAKAKILVKFTYGINVANATLKVGENAAKPIYYQGEALDAGRVKAGMFVLLQYDGTNFNIVGDIAKMDAYYKNLHAGLADNLFGSTQTTDVFTFRPTAGIQDIESGDAPVGGGAIRKVEGNGVSWNQLVQNGDFSDGTTGWTAQYGTGSVSNGVYTYTSTESSGAARIEKAFLSIEGHKYFISLDTDLNVVEISVQFDDNNNLFAIANGKAKGISASSDSPSGALRIYTGSVSVGTTVHFSNIQIIDLTLLGIDNLTTVAEVESWLANNIGLKDYYPYNAGELIPTKEFTVKSVGFNQWDEEWEIGALYYRADLSNFGEENNNVSNQIRAKNFIPALPNTSYKNGSTDAFIICYDINKKGIASAGFITPNAIFTTPSDCHYLRFYCVAGYGTTYKGDICINLSYDGDRDGEYEEHWERSVTLDTTMYTGKLNGSGNSVVVFPDGMMGVYDVHDEIVMNKGTRRCGKFIITENTPTSAISVSSLSLGCVFLHINDKALRPHCILSNWYVSDNVSVDTGGQPDKTARGAVDIDVCVRDTSKFVQGMTIEQVRDALVGLEIIYELATPEEYILDEDILPIQYRVDNYGTEEVLLGNDEGIVSCSPKMTIRYGINAADTIADLPHSYVSALPQQLSEDNKAQARQNIGITLPLPIEQVKDYKTGMTLDQVLNYIKPYVETEYYVDMGLPSGVLWAKRNVDVTQTDGFAASEYSYDASFFSWGNVDGHNQTNAVFDYSFDATTYTSTSGAKLTGNISASYDAARTACGAPWRMPSGKEFQELIDNCDFIDANGDLIPSTQNNKFVTLNGVVGIRLKSKNNGGILFFPACGYGINTNRLNAATIGYYASATIYSDTKCRAMYAYNLGQYGSGVSPNTDGDKYFGLTIRPVM